jgi:hypothetical protein
MGMEGGTAMDIKVGDTFKSSSYGVDFSVEKILNDMVVNGQLRIVNGAGQCRPLEVSIFWNQVGPQGPPGTTNLLITHQGIDVTLTDARAQVLLLN